MSELIKHGLSIGINRIENNFFVKLTIEGTLTHEDYDVMLPMIENAIKGIDKPHIKLLVDATLFNGWELRAMWDDLKFGLTHLTLFTKIAFVGHKKWEEYAIKISNWFMIGEIEYFETMDEALYWIHTQKPQLDIVQRELASRKVAIEKSFEELFQKNIKITDWNIPEVDDQEVAEILLEILSKKLDDIKQDVREGKYQNY